MAQLTVPAEIRSLVAMKPEVTAGVDVFAGTYTGADVIQAEASSIRFTPDENLTRNTMTGGNRGQQRPIIGAHTGRLDFSMWFRGRGVAYATGTRPFIDLPLRGCGLSSTVDATVGVEKVTYQPSDTLETMTIYAIVEVPGGNALAIKMVGCLGTFAASGRNGGPQRFDFTYFGSYSRADLAYVAGTVPRDPQYPTLKSAAFQIGSANYAPRIENVGFALGNEVAPVADINAVSGVVGFNIFNRAPELTIDPEADREANSAWWASIEDGDPLMDCTFALGTVQYNRLKWRFAANGTDPGLSVLPQTLGARGGIRSLQTRLMALINTGNDDFSLVAD